MTTNTKPKVEPKTVPHHAVGQRIDNYLVTQLKGVPKTRIYRALRKGEVRVNGKRTKPVYRLCEGDILRLPPLRVSEAKAAPVISEAAVSRLQENILFEDQHLMILNKPNGFAVHAGSGVSVGVIDILRSQLAEDGYIELVHRLDKETSGCLLLAKSGDVLRQLQTLLKEDSVDKRYLALVRGQWPRSLKRVEAALDRPTEQSGERMVFVSEQGKPAVTEFVVQQEYDEASLVEAKLITGRTHQIRVHAAHMRHPVAGDEKYGNKAFNRHMKQFGLRRLFLHASMLSFHHPVTHEKVKVIAPLDAKLQRCLDAMA